MNEIDALNILTLNTHREENGCWIPNTKSRSIRVSGKTVTYSFLAWMQFAGSYNYSKSYRPIRKCNDGWCYNPDHLIFDEMERFYYYSERDDSTGCWNWTHSKDGGGYGVFVCTKYGKEKAHRVSYLENKGEIPVGSFVCHHCDNPGCINPEHLFLGTNQENIDDKVKKNRQSRLYGKANGRTILSEEDIKNMRLDYKNGKYSYRGLTIKYGISQTQVARIIKNKSWSWV